VKQDKIISRGHNKVISTNDPTAHAEIIAIREACQTLETFQLEGCEIYTSCEPCPMCLGAIYWARPDVVYFANTRKDAAEIGFDDSMIYDEINAKMEERKIPLINLQSENAKEIFHKWKEKNDKTIY
jgi:tRNA(Arg) A34 adenosine deaminase TadA